MVADNAPYNSVAFHLRRIGRVALWCLIIVLVAFTLWVVSNMRGSDRRAILFRKTVSLYWRNPAREAAKAAEHGDFRLGVAYSFGPVPGPSSLPGVECTLWFLSASATGKSLSQSDMRRPGDDMHATAAHRFLRRYNRALVTNAAFPYPELCAAEGARPAPSYRGPVRDYAEAARAGDLAAVNRFGAARRPGIDDRDMLGYTALQWAIRDKHRDVAIALLALGANPNLRGPDRFGGTDRGPAPLARAIRDRDYGLARILLARGARMTGGTGFCDLGTGLMQDSCTWAGLAASRGLLGLVPSALAGQPIARIDPEDPDYEPSATQEVAIVFVDAAQKNEALAARLVPFVSEDEPGARVAWLLSTGHPALAHSFALANASRLGFSRAESALWIAAAVNHQDDALAFLADYGGELNLLSKHRLDACRSAAASGNLATLVSCVREAASREAAIEARIRKADIPGLLRLLAEAADLHVHHRASIPDLIVRAGTPAMARAVLPLMAPLDGGQKSWRPDGHTYHGPALSRWSGLAALRLRLAAEPASLREALARKDPEIISAIVAAHPDDMIRQLRSVLLSVSSPPPSNFEERTGPGHFADAPREPQRSIALMLIREVGRAGEAQQLERALQVTVAEGWDELTGAILRAGFDASRARRPYRIWERWTDFGMPCRPSTGALLVRSGLSVTYTLDPLLNGRPPMWVLVASCANSVSARVLARASPAQLDYVEEDGSTLLDEAEERQRPHMAEALRALGVRRGRDLVGGRSVRRNRFRAAIDWDLVQSEEVR
jgi:hypothetical protein